MNDVSRLDGYIEKSCFNGGTLVGSEDERLSFDDVHFKDVSFSGSELRAAEFVDVVFQNCDFSNVKFTNAFFYRCEFVNSKIIGADFASAKLRHTIFDGARGVIVTLVFLE